MKKKLMILFCVILAAGILLAVLYNVPKTFGKGIELSAVDHIYVFDGNTGRGFTIDDPGDIQYIIGNIQSRSMKRDGLSLGRMGYRFRIDCMDKEEKNIIRQFIINSDDTIRQDPFFYRCDGGLCFDYLISMEEKYASD